MRRSSEEAYEPPAEPAVPWGPGWSAATVIEALERWVTVERQSKIRRVVANRLESVTVVLDATYDPHNAGAVVRTCDAFGVQWVHVIERGDPFMLARRSARGTERWVELVRHRTVEHLVGTLRAQSHSVVVTHPEGELEPADLGSLPRPALVLGNEHDGVRPELRRAAQYSVRVPMRGFVESLNVSVSAAVLLLAATQGRPGDVSLAKQELLYAKGLFRSLPRAGELLAATRQRSS
jgi:tRNA (guanosine-2'-O-)-methyltransferase